MDITVGILSRPEYYTHYTEGYSLLLYFTVKFTELCTVALAC